MAAFCICMIVILIIAIYFITDKDGESNGKDYRIKYFSIVKFILLIIIQNINII